MAYPPHIFQPLGKFDLDPAAPIENRDWIGATRTFTELEDGLAQHWEGRVWLNPPYGRGIGQWVKKMAEHVKNGGAGIASSSQGPTLNTGNSMYSL